MPSIRLRLLKWLIGPILLLNLAGGVLTYLLAWVPAQSAFDQGLVDAAGALGARVQPGDGAGHMGGGARIDLPPQAEQVLRADQSDAVYFAVRAGERLLAGDADFPPPRRGAAARDAGPAGASTDSSAVASTDAATAFLTAAPTAAPTAASAATPTGVVNPASQDEVRAAAAFPPSAPTVNGNAALVPQRAFQASQAYDGVMRGEPVRIVALRSGTGEGAVEIGVAKTLRKRQQIRSATFRALLLLETLLTLASVGLIWFSVSSGLSPLQRMRGDLNGRNIAAAGDLASDLTPIPDGAVPYELAPVVGAFNGLLERLRAGARAQHDFLADVAHQLRTPLAGLQTQLEWLQKRHAGEADSAQSIALMLSSTERMIRQTNQLLALARAEPSHFERTRLEPLRLDALVAESVQHFVGEAAKKSIDLGFELAAATVLGDRFLLRDLVDNLIDNAIRYTPDGGVVTVGCAGSTFSVEDSGPGIPPARREQVFQRFIRLDDKSTGSGLGLAIVRDIALAHDAVVTIDASAGGQGARFAVVFPPVPA
jgi:two-component system sensor histidine kinase TctE